MISQSPSNLLIKKWSSFYIPGNPPRRFDIDWCHNLLNGWPNIKNSLKKLFKIVIDRMAPPSKVRTHDKYLIELIIKDTKTNKHQL